MEERERTAEGAEECFAEFLARREAGDGPDFEAWVRRHPQHEQALRRLHDGWSGFEDELREVAYGVFQRVAGSLAPRAEPRVECAEARSGARFADFRLMRLLGRGGMGEVWEAEQLSLRRRVALKLLPSSIASSERHRRRFEREAEAGARLNHPNIVAVHDYGHAGGRPYLVEELVEGGRTLAETLRRGDAGGLGPAHWRRVCDLALSVARALEVAHAAGVIHRDVKPQNVLLTPDGEPKVSDFGVARIVDGEPISSEGETLGTYCYMSPEQVARRQRPLDHRTDVFSLGATLYEMLTLERAFPGRSTPEIAQSILYHDPPSPDRVRPGVPRELAAICSKALEKEPDERYASMAELADDLRRFLVNEPVRAAPPGPVQRLRKWVRRHPAIATVALVSLLAAAGVAGLAGVHAAHRRDMARENAYLLASLDIGGDQLDRALETVAQAHAAHGARPTGHLILARGCYRWGRVDEAQEHLERALALGFRPAPELAASALDRCTYGLYLLATRGEDAAGLAEAERWLAPLVDDPVELERTPQLLAGAFGLYQARKALGDLDGAQRALRTYQRGLPSSNAYARLVQAYLLELEGDLPRAIEELDALCEEIDEGREKELRVHRRLGRYLLELGRRDRAQVHLERAVAEFPEDHWSLGNLAGLHYERARRAPSEELEEHLAASAGAARAALAITPQAPNVHLLAAGAILRLERRLADGVAPSAAELAEARARARELREVVGQVGMARDAEAQILFLEGRVALFVRGDLDAAREAYRRCVEHVPAHVPARIALAQSLWGTGQDAEILAHLERALDDHERMQGERASAPEPEGGLRISSSHEHWQTCQVWAFGAATRLGLAERAGAALAAIEDDLAGGGPWPPAELLNLCEFLATSPIESSRDCGLARRLMQTHDLRARLADEPGVEAVLRAIDDACGD